MGTPESARGIRPRRKRSNAEKTAESAGVTTGAGRLSRTERLNLGTLSLAMRHGLFRDPSDEALEAFAADEAQFLAKINAATQAENPTAENPTAEKPAESAEVTCISIMAAWIRWGRPHWSRAMNLSELWPKKALKQRTDGRSEIV